MLRKAANAGCRSALGWIQKTGQPRQNAALEDIAKLAKQTEEHSNMKSNDAKVEQVETVSSQDEVKEDIFSVEEIRIEEMAIDGICGVY